MDVCDTSVASLAGVSRFDFTHYIMLDLFWRFWMCFYQKHIVLFSYFGPAFSISLRERIDTLYLDIFEARYLDMARVAWLQDSA